PLWRVQHGDPRDAGRRARGPQRLVRSGLDRAPARQPPLPRGQGRRGDRAVLPAGRAHRVPPGTGRGYAMSAARPPEGARTAAAGAGIPTPFSIADTAACLDGLLRSRCSVRAFRDEPVPRETVLEILRVAS